MRNRSLPFFLGIALLQAVTLHVSPAKAAENSRPNVLFIAIDDLNDWVGCLQGHPQVRTPNIDRLAARGTLFTNAHCQAPLCNPSRTSLLTGLRPSTTGIYGLAPWIRDVAAWEDVVSLPRYFAAHGYRTLATGKIWHGGYPRPPHREEEFHEWGPGASVGARPEHKLIPPTPGGNHPLMDWGTFPHEDEEKGDWQVASWAVNRLASPPEEPFFLGVGFFLPHVPCYATPRWFELYPENRLLLPTIMPSDRADTPDFSWYLHWDLPEPRLSWLRKSGTWHSLVRSYLACISFVDSQVGRVLDALDESGLAENTIVVLWSDHGYHLGEKEISGKNTLWERSTHVPLIFAGPSIPPGVLCKEPVELLDIYPTLIDLCRLPQKAGLEGHSLLPQLKDSATSRAWPAITTHNPGNHSVRTLRWRYIRYADGSEELYDMQSDPGEWHNLASSPEYAATKAELARFLPAESAAPAPGSRHRVLVNQAGQWLWEGKPIDGAQGIQP